MAPIPWTNRSRSISDDLSSFKTLMTEKFASETMPQMSLNYEKKKLLHWLQMLQIFDLCVKFKVSEYPFKQNKNTLKNIKVLLYTHFYNISLNVL